MKLGGAFGFQLSQDPCETKGETLWNSHKAIYVLWVRLFDNQGRGGLDGHVQWRPTNTPIRKNDHIKVQLAKRVKGRKNMLGIGGKHDHRYS